MGGRSAKAVQLLKDNGIEAKNVKGGILAWIDQVDPSLAEVLTRRLPFHTIGREPRLRLKA